MAGGLQQPVHVDNIGLHVGAGIISALENKADWKLQGMMKRKKGPLYHDINGLGLL